MSRQNITKDEVEIKSYVVERIKGKLCVVGSRWMVGYTPAHCPTPQAALDFAIDKMQGEIQSLMADRDLLIEMRYGG